MPRLPLRNSNRVVVPQGHPYAESRKPPTRQPSHVFSGVTTMLYVGNLSWDVTWQDLKDHFKQCGHVVRANILEGADGRSKGCGLVEYGDTRDAQRAIATLTDTELKGRQIFVRQRETTHSSNENPPSELIRMNVFGLQVPRFHPLKYRE